MSVIITTDQHPLTITPTNGEHIYTLQSTGATLTDFKFVIDVYFQPNTTNKKMSRIKIRPNSYNKAIFDVGEIIKTFLKVNPRTTGTTYPFLNYVSDENHIITLSDAQQTRDYNAYNLWNGGSPNGNLDQLWHVEQYQCKVGYEYRQNGVLITGFTDSVNQPPVINIFPGVDNKTIPSPDLLAATLGGSYTFPSNFFQMDTQGWYYYDLFRHVYQWSGAQECHTYQATNPIDNESIISFDYVDCDGVLQSISGEPGNTISFCGYFSQWTATTEGQYVHPVDGGICEGYTRVVNCGPKEFLNAAGQNCGYGVKDSNTFTKLVRRRQHHPDCPIIVSFLNGTNDYFSNDVYSIGVKGSTGHTQDYEFEAEIENRNTPNVSIVNEPINSLFRNAVFYLPYNITSGDTLNAIPTDSKKVMFFGTTYQSSFNDRMNIQSATTELLEFHFVDRDCLSTPIHLLFLNGRGMWDTITLGGRSTKQIDVERKSYRQEMSLNKQFYSRGSSNRGTTVYEQNANYQITAKSWFINQCDMVIYEELFMSPEVYIIEGTTIEDLSCVSCLNEIRLYQHLTPVVLTDRTFQEYQQKYDKLYQYTFTMEYGGLKRFRTQG
jgi:hypothetical protein